MKTLADLESRLRKELTIWAHRQSQDIYADFYLYYIPTTTEHDGGIIIAKNPPANSDFKLARPDRIEKGCSFEQIFNRIRIHTLPHLPVLEV